MLMCIKEFIVRITYGGSPCLKNLLGIKTIVPLTYAIYAIFSIGKKILYFEKKVLVDFLFLFIEISYIDI
tara:strand:+ start:570 stop:779 length:210 start_codon:yes stop_codon:yes gene_type:complete